MDSIKDLLAIVPAAGALARFTGRGGEQAAFLLERGIAVVEPRCAACGVAFDSPRRSGARFRVALRVYDAHGDDDCAASMRLLVGTKVLVARAAGSLGPTLDRSITYVGARVMVASVRFGSGRCSPILLCRACGENVAAHLSYAAEANYAWDWLVDFRPRKLLARLGARLLRRRRDLPMLAMRALPDAR